jgi:hypothetical protein
MRLLKIMKLMPIIPWILSGILKGDTCCMIDRVAVAKGVMANNMPAVNGECPRFWQYSKRYGRMEK